MFEQLPTDWWWIAAANLTAWIYWPAVSSVLSGAALFWAIYLANRNSSDTRAREAVILANASSLLNLAASALNTYKQLVDAGRTDHDRLAKTILEGWDRTRLTERIQSLDAEKLPSLSAYAAFDVGRLEMVHAIIDLEVSKERNVVVEDLQTHIDTMIASSIVLKHEAAKRAID